MNLQKRLNIEDTYRSYMRMRYARERTKLEEVSDSRSRDSDIPEVNHEREEQRG